MDTKKEHLLEHHLQIKEFFELLIPELYLLDEISEMPLSLQAKLLRVLQEKKVTPIGGQRDIDVDVRVIATTNRNMMNEVKEKKFREDLYYRLNVFPIETLNLSDRKEDIIPISVAL